MEAERRCPTPQLATIHIATQAMADRGFEANADDVAAAPTQGDPIRRTASLHAEPPAGGHLEALGATAGSLRLDREGYHLISGRAARRSA
eukprot:9169818-Pyramimonas_sp.AAC.1